MRRTSAAIAVMLASCTPPVHEKKPPAEKPLAALPLQDGRMAIVSPIDEAATASPEALRQYLHLTGEIVSRKAISDGFIATIDTETYVIRQIRNSWFRCHAPVTEDAGRDDLLRVCKTYRP